MKLENICYLCMKSNRYNHDLIWKDNLQLCDTCYQQYCESKNAQKSMLIGAIIRHRNYISENLNGREI